MIIAKCRECGEKYQLESGKNVFDFQCECGGDLKETNQEDENVSLGTKVDFSDLESMIKTITKDDAVFEGKVKDTPVVKTQEIVKDKIDEYNDETSGNSETDQIKNILKESIDNRKGMRWAMNQMVENIDGMTREKAESIARTETVRARNQAELVKAEAKGLEYFVVVSAGDCCDECYETYDGNTFHVPEDEDMLPPLHTNCRCTATFFRTEEHAETMAGATSKPR